MEKKRILIVDDDQGVLEFMEETLTSSGYDAVTCPDTSCAMTLLASDASFDLAIVDLVMPNMNGLEFHERIKRMRPNLPCILATGHTSIESYLQALSNGVFEYLNKPFRRRELTAIVAAALK